MQWEDYRTAKQGARNILPADKYAEFYDDLRKRILSNKDAWRADWQTIFEDELEPYL